jgi:hypothetical protein
MAASRERERAIGKQKRGRLEQEVPILLLSHFLFSVSIPSGPTFSFGPSPTPPTDKRWEVFIGTAVIRMNEKETSKHANKRTNSFARLA